MAIEGQRLMSKTQHYRKVTKPLLERKRRARMNFYLDELKDLIVDTMEAQGEHVTKLEKADILEMTVQYLKTKKHIEENRDKQQKVDPEKFQAGYTQAAYEVSKVFASFPGLDLKFGTKLMKHLGYQLKDMKAVPNSPSQLTYQQETGSNGFNSVQFHDSKFIKMMNPEEPQECGEVWRPW
ncbi:enhancer of split mdelta protein [Episyrphus balteatus]|uniref:enhancer of split mdelta protein n=1 Tax=Episyrphus balteatus TaxID=286459 RepID=UPI0024852B90|nr:enhancer of split mdelta protein [Episyrphus balteatus]